MLEQKIKLKEAMNEKKPKKIIKELMREYAVAYSKIENPLKNEIFSYKDLFLNYLEYMNRKDIK